MKRIIFPILGVLLIILSTCKKKTEDEYSYLLNIAAVLGYDLDFQSPVLLTSKGTYIAPQLRNDFLYLGNGATILASIEFNKNEQISSEYIILSDVVYDLVDKVLPQATAGGGFYDYDFINVIDSIAPYDMVSNVGFFIFFHTAPVLQQYNYEMTYDSDQAAAEDIPTVYFRAKENGKDDVNKTGVFQRICAFNLNNFVETYKNSENKLEINIKFFTGREDGVDIYKDWKHNPLELIVNE